MSRAVEGMVLGALSGLVATLPMTAAMSRLHQELPQPERYPLPPRELAEDLPPWAGGKATATLVYHFLYGAVTGGLFGAFAGRRDVPSGALYGVMVWLASYLGWIPLSRCLTIATQHPPRRNGLMLIAHLVWGASLAVGLRELERSKSASFSRATSSDRRLKDRPEGHQ